MKIAGATTRVGLCLALIVFAVAEILPALAQDDPAKYPERAIHIIVGFAAGGGNDIIARIYGQKLSESLGQPVIIENKPGAGAILGTEYVAKAPADGYTLLMSASGLSINPAVYAKLPYDAIKDFVAVSELGSYPLFMIVNAASPVKSVAELVAYAKANPDKTNYASSSASFQLVTELFKQKTGAPMQVIPYKSANESVLAVVSGQVTTTIADSGPVSGQIRSGTVRALAVTSVKRSEDFPEVPTLKEVGVDVDAVLWSGIFAPRNTPPSIVKKLEGELMRITGLPDVMARLKQLGIEPIGSSSAAFARILAADIARWDEVAKAGHIRIEQ
jgi:tripartite-type tricarboxylate transporter receptor subunit TctC